MEKSRKQTRFAVLLVAIVAGLVAALVTPAVSGASQPRVVTASNGTIPIAGLGFAGTFGDANVGAAARFKVANDNKEVKGYTFDYKEFADDKNDATTAISEARRIVTQDGIMAIVPAVSVNTPADYLTSQQIPWFGPGYDLSFCPPSGKGGWGFGVYGCLLPANPKRLPAVQYELMKKQLASKGIQKPTMAFLASDSTTGKASAQSTASTATGAGFDVVYSQGVFPSPPAVVGDYSPYAQKLLTSNNGKAPDLIFLTIAPGSALQLISAIKGQGYTGTFLSPFYTNVLLKPLTGAYVFLQFAGYEANVKGVQDMVAAVSAYKPGQQSTLTTAGGYFAADMFIQAVKNSLKGSKTLTSASIQKAASKLTYEIKGTVGPTIYPDSYKYSVKNCGTLEYDADGTAFSIAQPFTCSTKTYPILPKYANGVG